MYWLRPLSVHRWRQPKNGEESLFAGHWASSEPSCASDHVSPLPATGCERLVHVLLSGELENRPSSFQPLMKQSSNAANTLRRTAALHTVFTRKSGAKPARTRARLSTCYLQPRLNCVFYFLFLFNFFDSQHVATRHLLTVSVRRLFLFCFFVLFASEPVVSLRRWDWKDLTRITGWPGFCF